MTTLSPTASALTPAPAIPQSRWNDLFAAFLDPALSLPALAARFNTTVLAIKDWASLPEIAAHLRGLAALAELRARTLAAEGTARAVAALDQVLRSTPLTPLPDNAASNTAPDPAATVARARLAETIRKTASAILRLAAARPSTLTLAPQDPPAPLPLQPEHTSRPDPFTRTAAPPPPAARLLAAGGST